MEKICQEVETVALASWPWHKELALLRFDRGVRDSASRIDVAITNMAAILAQNGLENVRILGEYEAPF